MNILAVVVTHNRCNLLSRCLDSLEAQTRKANSIVVINNASTDGTRQMLVDRKINFITQDNVGSAGGWARGIDIALKEEFDACWLMDDDGYADLNALYHLEKAFDSDTACVSSLVVKEDDHNSFVFPLPVLDKHKLPKIFGFPRKLYSYQNLHRKHPESSYPFACLFNGALISTKAIKKIGNVNEEFFLMGDEVDYFFRLRKVGSVSSIKKALHYHPDVSKREFNEVKIYYFIKNSIILNFRYFNLPYFRHLMVIAAILGRVLSRNGLIYFLSLLLGTRSKIFYSAIGNGLKNRIGRDFES